MKMRAIALGGASLAMVVLLTTPLANGALIEEDEIVNIKQSVAVLRFLYGQLAEIENNLKAVRFTTEVTKKQYETQQELIRKEKAKGDKADKIKLDWYERTLAKLQRQVKKLEDTNLEKIYAERKKEIFQEIAVQQASLDAKIEEFRLHFGKEPDVDLEVRGRVSRLKPKVTRPPYLKL